MDRCTQPSLPVYSRELEDFLHRVRTANEVSALAALLDAFSRDLGFKHFAIAHHADMRAAHPGQILLHNYPAEWAEEFIGKAYFVDDPVHQACLRTHLAFEWSAAGDLLQLTRAHLQFFEIAYRHGLCDGVSVPCNIPGEWRGSCSFAANRPLTQGSGVLPILQLAGAFAFQAARRLAGAQGSPAKRRARLSPRQRECTVLAAQGKSDTDIGTILSLSPVTVRHYLDSARKAFDLASRQQLIVAALFYGEVSFIEC